MAQGKDSTLWVSSDDTASGTMLAVGFQGDMTINPGKGVATTKYKRNEQESSQTDDGFSVDLNMGTQVPKSAGQTKIWELHDSGVAGYFQILHNLTGGDEYAFAGVVAINTIGKPVSGVDTVTTKVGASGIVTRSVKP